MEALCCALWMRLMTTASQCGTGKRVIRATRLQRPRLVVSTNIPYHKIKRKLVFYNFHYLLLINVRGKNLEV